MPSDIDVAIVGGGPAGAFAGVLLARAGRRVVIIDRRNEGQGKACGHCLNGRVNSLMDRTGVLPTVETLLHERTEGVQIYVSGRATLALQSKPGMEFGRGYVIDRTRFDSALLGLAESVGAVVHRGSRGTIDTGQSDRVSVYVRSRCGLQDRVYRTRLVVGADGLGSRVAQSLGLARKTRQRNWAFACDVPECDELELDRRMIHMFLLDSGYVGLVHSPTRGWHAGAFVNTKRSGRCSAKDFLERARQQHTLLHGIFRDRVSVRTAGMHAAGPMPWAPRCTANKRGALVGDAAGYVEPFTGEGLCWAMESAELLARTVVEQRADVWSGGAADRYHKRWQKTIGRGLRRCRLAVGLLRYPSIMHCVAQATTLDDQMTGLLLRQFWSAQQREVVA